MGHSSWPKQLVPQEMAGNSQIQGVRHGISHSLRPLQVWGLFKGLSQSKRCGAKQPLHRQRLMPKTQQDLLRRDPLSLYSVPQYCRAKGLFHTGTRKNQGLALSKLPKRALSVPSVPCEPPFHAAHQGPRSRGWVCTSTCISRSSWQVTFPPAPMSPLRASRAQSAASG